MPRFARFLKLYWTDLVTCSSKIIADPVRIEIFQGPRSYDIFAPIVPPIVRAGVEHTLVVPQHMEVPGNRTYIELLARTDASSARRQYCEDHIDRVVAQLSALLSPNLFAKEVWSGWLSDPEYLIADMWLQLAPPVDVDADKLEKQLAAFRSAVSNDADIEQRFTLMAKFFARAVATPPGEERFLWLWTVLEIFPMRDTSNIQPILDHLSQTTGRPTTLVKDKLDIGRLFGARSRLVHDGRLAFDVEELGRVLTKLEAIDVTVLQSLAGLPYAGQLDGYFS